MKAFLRFFFKLLYHQFAFAYDLVAATVSVGRWQDWVTSILPFIAGTRVLEIGFGPGYLQRLLLSRGLLVVGIDESWQMALLAQRNLKRFFANVESVPSARPTPQIAYTQKSLTRGVAQALPFSAGSFDTVVATFPAEYIRDQATLLEVKRCLSDGGRFIVLPVAMQMGRGLLERATSLLFRITRQTPVDPLDVVKERLSKPFVESGFDVEIEEVQVRSSLLLVILAVPQTMPL